MCKVILYRRLSLAVFDLIVNGPQSFDERRVRMIQSGVHRVGDQWALVSLEEVDEAGFERLAMVVLHCEGVSLVLSPANEVHANEVQYEADRHVDFQEEEKVEEVRHVFEAEGLDDALVAEHEAEAEEHDKEGDT